MKNTFRLFIHSVLFCLIGVLFLTPGASFCADEPESEDMRQGNKAFSAGDYASAERFYKKALVLLDSPLWEKCMLQLSRVYLKQGDTGAASRTLEQLTKRSPKFPTGVLPGMIQIASGNYQQAVKKLSQVVSKNGPERLEALYQLGYAWLMLENYDEALKVFTELDNSPIPEVSMRGRHARIYTLIHAGNYPQAAELLAKTPQPPEASELSLLLQVKSGKFADFKAAWSKKRKESGDPRPEKLLYEICRNGAALAEKENDLEFAVICLNDSFKFAPDDARRKDVMHQLFNIQSRTDIYGAVETVRRYCTAFPAAADRALLMIQSGRLLSANGKYAEAVGIFRQVMKDDESLLDERRSAAFDAAAAAEKGGLFDVAREMHLYLISRSTTPEIKQLSEFRLGEFYIRRKDHAQAEKYFNQVILQGGQKAEEARYRLLTVLMESKQYDRARETAAALLTAQNPEYANYARFRLAELTELAGDFIPARRLYLEYIEKAPSSYLAPAAAFSAARLAERSGSTAVAAKEYFDFAGKYPSDINTAAALFLALRADCLTGNDQIAGKCLEVMSGKYAGTPEYNAALLQMADYFFNKKDHVRALEFLKRRPQDNNHEISVFLLWEARLQKASGNTAAALQLGRELLTKYPDSHETAEAHFLCGNILADLGENQQALNHFYQAEKSGKSVVFKEIVSGRIADCAAAVYTGSDFDRRFLKEALRRYSKLAEDAKLPAVKLQSLCKSGQCHVLLGDLRKGLEYFEKTLYFAALLKSNHLSPDAAWCARAAYAGAKAALKGKLPERLVRALRIIRLYEELALPGTGENFDVLRRELQNSYNLLKGKGQ